MSKIKSAQNQNQQASQDRSDDPIDEQGMEMITDHAAEVVNVAVPGLGSVLAALKTMSEVGACGQTSAGNSTAPAVQQQPAGQPQLKRQRTL